MTNEQTNNRLNNLSNEKFRVYLITKGELTDRNFDEQSANFLNIIESAVEAKIPLIQIREKKLSARPLFEITRKSVEITKNSETKLLVNDRADIALAAKADGVHLTSNSIPTEKIRKNFSEKFIIGVSCHSLEKCLEAKNQGADFAVLSPIFPTPNKGKPLGLNALREVRENLKSFPIIALGGVDETNYAEILQIADGFAAIRFLNEFLQKHKDTTTQNFFVRS